MIENTSKRIENVKKWTHKMNALIERLVTGSIIDFVFLLGCLLLAALMVYRLFFGIEFTDEAYAVSDVLAAMHGNLPYTDDTVIAAGQVFVPLTLYRIYELIVPSMEGFFLYSRITFTIFRFIVIAIIYKSLADVLERKWRLLIVGLLIVYSGVIANWGYNGTSMVLALLTVFLLYKSLHEGNKGRSHFIKLVFCGFISALTVFAHPAYATMVIANIVLIFLASSNKIREVLSYCAGGLVTIVIVILPIIVKSGIGRFIYGMESCFITAPDNFIKTTVGERARDVIDLGSRWWLLVIFVSIVIFIISIKYIRINKQRMSYSEYWLLSVSITFLMCLCFAIYRGFDLPQVTGIICVVAFILLIPTYDGPGALAWYFGIYNILFIILLTFTSLTGNRFYYCIPMTIPILIDLFKARYRLFHEIAAVIVILLIVMLGRYSFKNIYRDDSFRNLTTKVEAGVYKGIYTTPDRANDVVELENYINENISLNEAVLFRDNVPVAYLIRNKNICDVRTWDIMQYTYGCNDPTLMYRYYKNKQQIPDVIAYVDFGRDEILSIEKSEDEFQFNKFVNEYYYLDKDDFANNTFRVLIYRNNGTFDGDFDGLLNSIVK